MEKIDITGMRFGRLVALRRGESRAGRSFWLFACDCGAEKFIGLVHVRSGRTQSCGCLLREVLKSKEHADRCRRASKLPRSHGLSRTPEYYVWKAMRQRCQNQNNKDFRWYGGLGVKVCDRWSRFENFINDMGPSGGLTIDRIDPFGDYSPDNCRWASWEVQRGNKRK